MDGFKRPWLVSAYLWTAELLYGPFAWAYDAIAWLVSFGYWGRWRLDSLAYIQPGSILEIGFGTGELLIALAERGYDVIGLELSAQMHRVTRGKLHRRKIIPKCIQGKTEAIPFRAGVFDTILSTFPSHYIFTEGSLREIRRVLRCGGRCVVVGLGVQFKSGIKRPLTNLWSGGISDHLIKHFIHKTERMGFKTRRIDHQTDAYTLPVLIMERNNAD